MKFHTSLDGLLRWRTNLERAANMELRRIHGEIRQCEEVIEYLAGEKVAVRARLAKGLNGGIRAAEFPAFSVVALEDSLKTARRLLSEMQLKKAEAETKFTISRQERKVVEMAIDRLRLNFEKERERRHQVLQDDATLQRMSRASVAEAAISAEIPET